MTGRDFNVVIIGGGPAGLSAALWCKDLGIDAVLLESGTHLGGQLTSTFNPIENYLGLKTSNGAELADKFVAQIEDQGCKIALNTRVSNIDFERCRVFCSSGEEFHYEYLVAATGVRRTMLNIPGEKEFAGKGVLYSGKRDQDLVYGKTVAIVGGGDAALENVQILAKTASKIILIHRRSEFRARPEFVDFALNCPKAEIVTNASVKRILGAESVSAVEILDLRTKEISTVKIDGVLVRIGVTPNIELLDGRVELDSGGYVRVDGNCATSISNVFAIGDLANPISPTISTAVGNGASAIKFVLSERFRRKGSK